MNLLLAHALLQAAEEQPSSALRVRGFQIAREVELMQDAHLVEGSVGEDGEGNPCAIITSVTDEGQKFIHSLMGVELCGPPREPLPSLDLSRSKAEQDG